MDFLNKTSAQFSDLFRSMTPGARITAGLLLAVVVISLAYLFSYQVSSTDTCLMSGRVFQPDELARVQAALGAKNLSCTSDGMRILIPRGREAEYMAALAEEGALPRGWNSTGDGLADASAFESPDSRKARLKQATEANLAFCVSKLEEVENARVMFDKTTTGGLRRQVVTSASVLAYPVGNRELSDRTVGGIRDLVSGALPPMKPEDVKVINGRTGQSYFVDSGAKSGIHGNRYFELTRYWEDKHTNDILKLLDYIPGVNARVTVRLDPTESLSATTLKPDNKGTAVSTTEKEIARDHEGAATSGRPGFDANKALALGPAQSRGSKENESETESTTMNVVGGTTEHTTSVGMTPIWMSATVIVPHSYLAKVWKQEHPAAEGEEAKTPEEKDLQDIEQKVVAHIKESIANQLPNMKDVADKKELVTVTVARGIKPEAMPEPSMAGGAMFWLSENWGTLGVIVLAFVSLGMLRSIVKSTPIESPTGQQTRAALALETGAAAAAGGGNSDTEVNTAQRRLANFAKGGASLRDELSEMVKEDPDAAANILRTWIDTPSVKV